MEILVPKFKIDISGKVRLQIFDDRGRTKNEQHFTNAIHDDLKNAFVNHMASSSGASAFHINTSSNWFTSAMTQQANKDGIFIDSASTSESTKSYDDNLGNPQHDMKLDSNLSTSYGGSNSCTWQAEGTWTGGDSDPNNASGSFTSMAIGKTFGISSNAPTFTTTFATATSSGDFTAFTLDANDVARVTWTITIS